MSDPLKAWRDALNEHERDRRTRDKEFARPRAPHSSELPPCPKCQFRALGLCKMYGESFLKCEHCGYEMR